MPVANELFELHVRTSTGPDVFTVVNDLNEYERTKSRATQRFPVFARVTPHAIGSPPETEYSIGGLFTPADAGQQALRAAELANTPATIRVLFDGLNGFAQEVRVSSYSRRNTADGGFQEFGFDFAPTADPVIVGTGPVE